MRATVLSSPPVRNAKATAMSDGRQAGVESEELHARLARHEREREDDADREVGEEEE